MQILDQGTDGVHARLSASTRWAETSSEEICCRKTASDNGDTGTGYETPKLCEILVALNTPRIDHGANGACGSRPQRWTASR